MKSINKVFLMGHLASDPEGKQTKNGKTVVSFPIAINHFYLSNGEKREETDFHRITVWQKLGEICLKYLKKGSGVFIEGRLRNRTYEGKNGIKRFITEIIADEINIITWLKTMETKENQPVAKN